MEWKLISWKLDSTFGHHSIINVICSHIEMCSKTFFLYSSSNSHAIFTSQIEPKRMWYFINFPLEIVLMAILARTFRKMLSDLIYLCLFFLQEDHIIWCIVTHMASFRSAQRVTLGRSNAENVFSGIFANKNKKPRKFVWHKVKTQVSHTVTPSNIHSSCEHFSRWNLLFMSLYSHNKTLSPWTV